MDEEAVRSRWRHSMTYALVAGGPAALVPFGAVWLHRHGVGLDILGVVLAVPLLFRVVFCRYLAAWSRHRPAWTNVGGLNAMAAVAALLSTVDLGLTGAILCWWIIGSAATMCVPLMDAAILASASPAEAATRLARTKAVAALSYLFAVSLLGLLIGRSGLSALTVWAGVTAAFAGASVIRRAKPQGADQPGRAVTVLIENPSAKAAGGGELSLALATAILIEASHGLQSVAMIHWAERGIASELNGILWATGTLADIVFLWLAAGPLRWITPSALLAIGGMAAVARWIGFALDPPLAVLFVLQALHALSFTAVCLAIVRYTYDVATDRDHGRQLLTWAASTGLAGGFAVLGATPIFHALGVKGYWVMTALAALGLAGAILLRRAERPAVSRSAPFRKTSAFPVALAERESPYRLAIASPGGRPSRHRRNNAPTLHP